jgi:hypothetical protein
MSIDKKADKDGMVRLDDLFGLNETVPEGGESGESNDKEEARDMVVSECEKFLAALDENERYDAIQDEIDKFIEGEDGRNLQCVIGDSYGTFGAAGRNKLDGATYRLWDLAKLVVFDTDYQGSKKRLLKHLARKWDIDGSVLPALEDAAKTLAAIKWERQELVESDKSFREVTAALASLEAREKETWLQLEELGVHADRGMSAIDEAFRGLDNATLAMARIFDPDFKEEDLANEGEEEYEEPGFGDMIVDGICIGILKIGDILCAPIEWLSDRIGDLYLK